MDINDYVINDSLGESRDELPAVDDIEKESDIVKQPADASRVVDSQHTENDLFALQVLRVSKSDYWAELEVEWSFNASGNSFTCYAKRYRAYDNGRSSGNVYLSFRSAGQWGYFELSNDDATQDGKWHTVSSGGYVTGNSDFAWLSFKYIYDRSGTSDVEMEVHNQILYAPPAPIIPPTGILTPPATVSGSGGVPGATVTLYKQNIGSIKCTGLVGAGGSWSVNVTGLGLGLGRNVIVGTQTAFGRTSGWSILADFAYLPPPVISEPTENAVKKIGDPFDVVVNGAPNEQIEVMNTEGTLLHAGGVSASTGVFRKPFNLANYPKGGLIVMTARHSRAGNVAWSSVRSFFLLATPSITAPTSGSTVELRPAISGSGASPGADRIKVYQGSTTTVIGESSVRNDGSWAITNLLTDLTPGPFTLEAQQFKGTVGSVRSVPLLILVRPPMPTITSRLIGERVELHGTGYNGTDVRMEIRLGDTGNPVYLETTVSSGTWSKEIPETLVPGTHAFTGLQSVSDGGSGRIFNSSWVPYHYVNVPAPKPTGVSVTVNGQRATFSGRGRQWGTNEVVVVIFNNGVDLRPTVPAASVQSNLNWTTTATADLAPGNYTNLTARQWVNYLWSGDSVKFSMIIGSPAPTFTEPPLTPPSGQRPRISGSAWPGSSIILSIPGKPNVPLTATGGSFALNAVEDWAPATYIITATAAFGGQTSAAASRTFTVKTPKPVITTAANAEVDLVPVIKGTGFKGCWVVVYSNVTHQSLGAGPVGSNGQWEVTLTEQAPSDLTVYAIQQEAQTSANVSERSDLRTVKVRVAKPVITVPAANGRPARTSRFSGTAPYGATVELSIKGQSQPFLKDIQVKSDNTWEASVTLVAGGPVTLEARTRYKTFASDPLDRVVMVVPAVPVIDTPRNGEALGRLLNISGFGYPGDTVHVQRTGNAYNFEPVTVKLDGTWSASLGHNMIATNGIKAFARAGAGLDSLASPTLTFSLLGLAPHITEPLQGDWVGVRPLFSGVATPGAAITVASWFNTADVLAPVTVADTFGRWAVSGNKDLPVGAARVVVRQTVEGKASEWAESGRFMVERKANQFDAPTVQYPFVGQEVGRRPMFSGTGEPYAEILIIKANNIATVLGRTLVDRNGRWALQSQIDLPVATTPYTYSVRQSRDGANSNWLLPNRSFVVIQVPSVLETPVIESPVDDAAQTLEPLPLFSGRGLPGAEVKVHPFDDSTQVYAKTVVDAQGNWSARCTFNLLVSATAYKITARQNMDGQFSAWPGMAANFKVTDKLDKPVVTSPPNGSSVSPHTVIRGTALPGAEVRLYRKDNSSFVWGRGVADTEGQWVIVLTGLPVGAFIVAGRAYKGELISLWMVDHVLNVIDAR
ncbi:hypothetical protein [Pseudomonas sp. S2_F03]